MKQYKCPKCGAPVHKDAELAWNVEKQEWGIALEWDCKCVECFEWTGSEQDCEVRT